MADLIDSDEDLSDGIEYLQQKFRRDQEKEEIELMKKVKRTIARIGALRGSVETTRPPRRTRTLPSRPRDSTSGT